MKVKLLASLAFLVATIVVATGLSANGGIVYLDDSGLSVANSDDGFNYGTIVTGPVAYSFQSLTSLKNDGGSISFYDPSLIGGEAGALSVINHFRQTEAGSLTLRLGDAEVGGYERIIVGDDPPFPGFGDPALGANIYLAGKLIFMEMDGYMPEEGDSFAIFGTKFTSIEVTLTQDDITFFDLPDNLYWNLSAFYTQGVISISAIPEPTTTVIGLGLCAIAFLFWRKR